jgi:receptor-type tyrosine-protein phosphatase Q
MTERHSLHCNVCNLSLYFLVPSVPTNTAFSNVQSTSVTLRWIKPDTILGYFQNYKITTQLRAQKCREWEPEECVEHQEVQYLYEANQTEDTVRGLKKFQWYRFQVAASTNAGYGNASSWISTQTLPGREYCPDIYSHCFLLGYLHVSHFYLFHCVQN